MTDEADKRFRLLTLGMLALPLVSLLLVQSLPGRGTSSVDALFVPLGVCTVAQELLSWKTWKESRLRLREARREGVASAGLRLTAAAAIVSGVVAPFWYALLSLTVVVRSSAPVAC